MNFFKRLQSGKRGFQICFSNPNHLTNFITDAQILWGIVRFIGVHIILMKHTIAARKCLMKNHSLPVLAPVTLPMQFCLNDSHFHSVTLKFGWMLRQDNRQVVSTNEIYPRNGPRVTCKQKVVNYISVYNLIHSIYHGRLLKIAFGVKFSRKNWPQMTD